MLIWIGITLLAVLTTIVGNSFPIFAFPESPYKLPYPAGKEYRVSQGNDTKREEKGSHYGIAKYAFDFNLADGDVIVASREGKTLSIQDKFGRGKCDQSHANLVNYILIDHGDGTSALYLHLQKDSTVVKEGEDVKQGQSIGKADSSGYVCGAHLHFQVQKTPSRIWVDDQGQKRGWWTQSIKISFADKDVLAKNSDGIPTGGKNNPYRSDNIMQAVSLPFSDPFAFCTAVSNTPFTIGPEGAKPEGYVGSLLPDVIRIGLGSRLRFPLNPDSTIHPWTWRCQGGKVLACSLGANLRCAEEREWLEIEPLSCKELRWGCEVRVINVAPQHLNVREAPGTDQKVLHSLQENALACVVDGPRGRDGYTWWRIRFNRTNEGWVAEFDPQIPTTHWLVSTERQCSSVSPTEIPTLEDRRAKAIAAAIQKSRALGQYKEGTGPFPNHLLYEVPGQFYIQYFMGTGNIEFHFLVPPTELSIDKAQLAMLELLEGYEDVACTFEAVLYYDIRVFRSEGKNLTIPVCPGQD